MLQFNTLHQTNTKLNVKENVNESLQVSHANASSGKEWRTHLKKPTLQMAPTFLRKPFKNTF